MQTQSAKVFVGKSPYVPAKGKVQGKIVTIDGQSFYCIENADAMPPFFISLISSSDHWMFISSTGGLTAGRINANFALFPYETDDKVTEHFEHTGSKTLLHVTTDGKNYLWEPFSTRFSGLYHVTRNLYKNIYGTHLIFEEINHDLAVSFRYAWQTSDRYGFVRTASLHNLSNQSLSINLLDGAQYIQPFGILSQSQIDTSNLLNAYKRNELEPQTNIGIYTLSSTLSDMPEPNESLKATTAWQFGLEAQAFLLSSAQLDAFRRGEELSAEVDLRAHRGAYFVNSQFVLQPQTTKEWHLVLDVNQDITDVIALRENLRSDAAQVWQDVVRDLAAGEKKLVQLVANSDGLQCTGDAMVNYHHFANTLFNIMRGGIFDDQYRIHKTDFLGYLKVHNRPLFENYQEQLSSLPDTFTVKELIAFGQQNASVDLLRLCYEYLPLTFSRRHGDPSRPWNQFSINLKNEDGSRKLDYQGNWRDIFQNWEPLAASYPSFIESMICKFLNATSADGYNPYRLTFDGFEWEVPDPDDPWGNIGYWGDHQIIYLQKLLELAEQYHPGRLESFLQTRMFAYANIPFRLRSFEDMLADWYKTIDLDWELNAAIEKKVQQIGTDAKLIMDENGSVIAVTMLEKLLNLLLAKVVNFVPDGGIWMNTQRPEWNDANNALVGKGISVVTTAYIYRYVNFFQHLLENSDVANFDVSSPLVTLLVELKAYLDAHQHDLTAGFDDASRFAFMRDLGEAGTKYRQAVYIGAVNGDQTPVTKSQILEFLSVLMVYLEKTLANNRREDGLFHAYNVLKLNGENIAVGHLPLMLEGQVAILSAGYLKPQESIQLLKDLRQSPLYRVDQHSYTLYPDRDMAGFLTKNVVPAKARQIPLIASLLEHGDRRLVIEDVHQGLHFNGTIHNHRDIKRILDELQKESAFAALVGQDREKVNALFEEVFDHSSFTGRSGTFFGYEGLGSIYWHMVTKLLLAVQENLWQVYEAEREVETARQICALYYDIRDGIGFNKTPAVYGSFPTDPYSHTPAGAGAKQPGMTGQVKEELMARWKELGLIVSEGTIIFLPKQLLEKEFLTEPAEFAYIDLHGKEQRLQLSSGSLGYTFSQVPVIYQKGESNKIEVLYADGSTKQIAGNQLPAQLSQRIFNRTAEIVKLIVTLPA